MTKRWRKLSNCHLYTPSAFSCSEPTAFSGTGNPAARASSASIVSKSPRPESVTNRFLTNPSISISDRPGPAA